jgi:hypothetical protein
VLGGGGGLVLGDLDVDRLGLSSGKGIYSSLHGVIPIDVSNTTSYRHGCCSASCFSWFITANNKKSFNEVVLLLWS